MNKLSHFEKYALAKMAKWYDPRTWNTDNLGGKIYRGIDRFVGGALPNLGGNYQGIAGNQGYLAPLGLAERNVKNKELKAQQQKQQKRNN